MGDDSASTPHTDLSAEASAKAEAQAMLDAFASVGATRFDVTRTTRGGDKEEFQRGVRLAELGRTLPHMLDTATARERNVIVRPHGPGVTFIQLDDLAADTLPRLAPAVFLTLETSPGNFQAWLALTGEEDKEFARRVRQEHRSRCDRQRRYARRRQPQFQGQVRRPSFRALPSGKHGPVI
jgi:hypothetical protein